MNGEAGPAVSGIEVARTLFGRLAGTEQRSRLTTGMKSRIPPVKGNAASEDFGTAN